MESQSVAAPAVGRVKRMGDEMRRLARLERNLGVVLLFTPVLLIVADGDVRGSISAYYDMADPWAFYVPLTAGAMLFLVNGLVKNAHAYNTLLGLALLGVIVFDHESWSVVHLVCAVAFFGGNFVVMLIFSTGKSTAIKIALGAGIVVAGVLWVTISLFWFEWASLAIVTLHFVLDSSSSTPYRALTPGEAPRLVPAR